MPRPPPPAAAFTSTGKPIVSASCLASIVRFDRAVRARNGRNAERLHRLLRGDLVAHQADVLGLRADEDDLVRLHDVGEMRVLGEKAVAGMDRVRARDLAGRDDRRDVEIGLARRRRTDADDFVGEPHMHGVRIGRRMHRDGRDAHLLAGAIDAERDLAAVRDQDLLEHRAIRSASAARRIRPADRRARESPRSRPATGAATGFIVFIASMMQTVAIGHFARRH